MTITPKEKNIEPDQKRKLSQQYNIFISKASIIIPSTIDKPTVNAIFSVSLDNTTYDNLRKT